MNKILIFTHEFLPFLGGVAVYNYLLATGLAGLGYQVVILTTSTRSKVKQERVIDAEIFLKWKITVARKKNIPRLNLLYWVFVLGKFLKSSNSHFDCMFITDYISQRISSFMNFRKRNLRYLITFHGSEIHTFFDKNFQTARIYKICFPVFRFFALAFFQRASGLIFVSYFTHDLFFRFFHKRIKQCQVIHNGISKVFLINKKKLERKEFFKKIFTLITISRLDPRKNHESVLRAIASFQGYYKERLRYIIVGEGSHQKFLKNLTANLGLNEVVFFKGNISERDKVKWLDAADCFIMPSKRILGSVEGLGIAFLEAGARGLPLIGSNHGGIPEIIKPNGNGFLVDPENHSEIGNAILSLMDNKLLLKKMSANSWKVVKENFLQKKMVQETDKFIKAAGVY